MLDLIISPPFIWLLLILLGISLELFLDVVGWGVVLASGAVAGLLLSFLGVPVTYQWLGAALATLASAPFVIRGMRRLNRGGQGSSLLTEGAHRGETFTVIRSGERLGIKIQGDFFPARSEHESALHEGQRVRFVRMEGITAFVVPAEDAVHAQRSDC